MVIRVSPVDMTSVTEIKSGQIQFIIYKREIKCKSFNSSSMFYKNTKQNKKTDTAFSI